MGTPLECQLKLIGESIALAPSRVVAGAECRVLRVLVSAEHEDLASIEGIGPFSALRGTLDFVELPPKAFKDARSILTPAPGDGHPAHAFHVEFSDLSDFSRDLERWPTPIDVWLTVELPSARPIDETGPWTWNPVEKPELRVLSIRMQTNSEGR